MELKKLNDIIVKPPPNVKKPIQNIKGKCMFDEIYANLFIVAKKKSGKSVVIWNILKNCIDKKTKIIIFCPTVKKDKCYRYITNYLKKKGNIVIIYQSIKDNDGTDQLNEILDDILPDDEGSDIDDSDEDKDNEDDDKILTLCIFGDEVKKRKKYKKRKCRPKNPPLIAPEYVFIFDDLSSELRSKSVTRLVKFNRHIKSKVILSSQYLYDMMPAGIRQLDYCITFAGLTTQQLEKIHTGLDLSIDMERFIDIYIKATRDKYNFLYIDSNKDEFRKNFNTQILIK